MPSVRRFEASVTYRDRQGQLQEEAFPIHAHDFKTAST